ncbi:hypothetical protein CLU79DRAFT_770348 [Phycomyces nitens]|nr:hypothetical protein CLU79DRAFT_770348 [Phycomyces nitens]
MNNYYSHAPYIPESSPPPCPPEPEESVLRELNIHIPIGIARALYDYIAKSPQDISFIKGDIIQVTEHVSPIQWRGTVDRMNGTFPKNYVESLGTFVPHSSSLPAPDLPQRPAAAPAPVPAPAPASATLPTFPKFGTGNDTQPSYNPAFYGLPSYGVGASSATPNQFDSLQYINEIQRISQQQQAALLSSHMNTMNKINEITQVNYNDQLEMQNQMVQQKMAEILGGNNTFANPVFSPTLNTPAPSSTKSDVLGKVVSATVSGIVGGLTGGSSFGLF